MLRALGLRSPIPSEAADIPTSIKGQAPGLWRAPGGGGGGTYVVGVSGVSGCVRYHKHHSVREWTI